MSRILDFRGDVPFSGDLFDESTYFDQFATQQPVQEAAIMNYTTTDDVIGSSSSDLSDQQEITLVLLQFCSAILSLIGSSTIVFKIIRNLSRTKSSLPYDRIILGLSSCDIASSLTYAVSPFLLPRETSPRAVALGNQSTCTYIGFMSQCVCLWAIWYNCILSFYYLLTVRFQVKRKEFSRKYELWLHLSGAIFFPLTATVALFGDWYAEERYNMICWIGEVPKGCYETGNCYGTMVAYIYGALPTVVTLFSVIINNLIIYIFVRRSLLSSPKTSTQSETSDIENNCSNEEGKDSSQGLSVKQQLAKEAATQGFLYVSTFLLTFLPAFLIQIIEGFLPRGMENLAQVYPLLVLNSILMPLQGFFNVFIYVRPTYNRFRAAHPEKSKWLILKQALFDQNIPRMAPVGTSNMPTTSPEKMQQDIQKKSVGSGFSMSLDKIMEEEGSVDEASEGDEDVKDERLSMTDRNLTNFTGSHSAFSKSAFDSNSGSRPFRIRDSE